MNHPSKTSISEFMDLIPEVSTISVITVTR
jgi:hypothetical protein